MAMKGMNFMKCPNCYHENADDALHCSECGENLQIIEEDEMAPGAQKSEKLAAIEERRLQKKKRKQRNKIILIVLIVALLAGLITSVALWFGKENLDRTSTDEPLVITDKASETPEQDEEAEPSESPTASPEPTASDEAPVATAGIPTITPLETPAPTTDTAVIQIPGTNSVETATKKPVSPKKPTASKKPSTTKKPSATKKPSPTAKPVTDNTPVNNNQNKPENVPPQATADNSVAATSVPQGEALLSKLIQVTDYVNDSASQRQLIKFTVAGAEYYAYNAGQFITGVKGFYSVTGATSGQYYNGLPIYNLTNVTSFNSTDYVLPQSSSVLLTGNDLKGLSKSQIDIARNEIFARHGRKFQKTELQNYFNSKSWYNINNNYNYSNDQLNVSEIEWKNAEFLLKYSK